MRLAGNNAACAKIRMELLTRFLIADSGEELIVISLVEGGTGNIFVQYKLHFRLFVIFTPDDITVDRRYFFMESPANAV